MASPVKDEAWLQWIERLMERSATPVRDTQLPRWLFHCCLDDQPNHLIPERYLRSGRWEGLAGRSLVLNSQCYFSTNEDLPADVSVPWSHLENFALQGKVVWIPDPGSGSLQPFWLGPELAALVSRMRPGDPAPPDSSPVALRTLAMANLLTPPDYVSVRREQWAQIIAKCRPQFQKKGYVPVGRLIHPFHVAALRRYYRHLIRTGQIHLGDGQSPVRYVKHNEPVARFFHHQLTRAVSDIAGEPVKASYVYLASYQAGAVLEEHTDREQCECSITFCLDFAPEPRDATPWPIYLRTTSGKVTVFQAIGDALLYRGRELPHWRDALPKGQTSTSLFFHYVRGSFTGKLD